MNRSELLPVALVVLLLTASIAISLYVWSVGREGDPTQPPPPPGTTIQMRAAQPGDTIKRESMYGLLRVTRLAYVGDVFQGEGVDTREGITVARDARPDLPVIVVSLEGVEYTVPVTERVMLVRRGARQP